MGKIAVWVPHDPRVRAQAHVTAVTRPWALLTI